MSDLIDRQEIIDRLDRVIEKGLVNIFSGEHPITAEVMKRVIEDLPSAEPEIIRCKDCKFGEQDEVGRWFCRSLGCQIGNEDGSGFCADAERRTDNANIDT